MKINSFAYFFVLILLFSLSSCKKEIVTNTKSPEQILTANSWQPGELRALEANATFYYKRNVTNAWNLDIEYVLFKPDFTGTYGDASGPTFSITWNFTNAEKTGIRWVIQYPQPVTINWEGVIYAESKLIYTQFLTRSNGTNSLASGFRIPR